MIELKDVRIRAGSFELGPVSFTIPRGEYAILMGPTGAGKTTILEVICGLRSAVSGSVLIDQVDVTGWRPGDRGLGYVPQDLALFPHLNVRQHLEFSLKLRRVGTQEIQRRVDELAEELAIRHLLDRSVKRLSGGESQRVALGRALAGRPEVLLLDEPLSALDQRTRKEVHELLKNIHRTSGVTTLHITHNDDEAEALATMRMELCSGQVRVCGTENGLAHDSGPVHGLGPVSHG